MSESTARSVAHYSIMEPSMKIIRAVKRLWRLGTCTHRNAMNWTLLSADLECPGEVVEAHFCRRCGRLLFGVKTSDQPQHNDHWLRVDKLDDDADQHQREPMDDKLRSLANTYSRVAAIPPAAAAE